MAKTLLTSFEWGGNTGNPPGVAYNIGSPTRQIVSVESDPAYTYPETWDKLGLLYMRYSRSGLAGVGQEAPMYTSFGTIIFVRRPPDPVDNTRCAQWTLAFQPFRWVEEGQINVYVNPVLLYERSGTWGAGFAT